MLQNRVQSQTYTENQNLLITFINKQHAVES